MHMLEGVRERLHIRPDKEPDKRTVYDLHVANSIEINTQADKLPEKVNINDPRLVELVAGLQNSISAQSKSLSLSIGSAAAKKRRG